MRRFLKLNYSIPVFTSNSRRKFGALGGDGTGGEGAKTPKKITLKHVPIPSRPLDEDFEVPHSSSKLSSSSFSSGSQSDEVVQRQRDIKGLDVEQSDPLDAAMAAISRKKNIDSEEPISQFGEINTDSMIPKKPQAKTGRRKKTMDDVLGDVLTEALAMKDQGQRPDVDTVYKKTQERLYEAEHGRKAPSGNTEEIQKKYLPFPPVLGMYRLEPLVYVATDIDGDVKDVRREAQGGGAMRRFVSPAPTAKAAPTGSSMRSGLVTMNFSKTGEEYIRDLDEATRKINADVFESESRRKAEQLEAYIAAHEDPWPIRAITRENPILNRNEADAKESSRIAARNAITRKIKSLEAELICLCQPGAEANPDGKTKQNIEDEVQSLQDELATNPVYLDDHSLMFRPRLGFNPVDEFSDAVDEHFYWEQQFVRFIRDVPLWQRRSLPFLHEHYRLVTHRLVRAEARFIACRDKALASVKASPTLFADTEKRIDRSRMLCADTHKSLSSPNYDPLRMKKKSLAGTLMGMSDEEFNDWVEVQKAEKNLLIAALAPE